MPLIAFIIYLIIALIIPKIPAINHAFAFFANYFYELSQTIASLVTGGTFKQMIISSNGIVKSVLKGGNSKFILFSGYLGTVCWGTLFFMMAENLHIKKVKLIAYLVGLITLAIIIFFTNDVFTKVVLTFITVFIVLIPAYRNISVIKVVIHITAIYTVINSLKVSLILFNGKHVNDAVTLANITKIPETFWIIIWCGIALIGLFISWKNIKKA